MTAAVIYKWTFYKKFCSFYSFVPSADGISGRVSKVMEFHNNIVMCCRLLGPCHCLSQCWRIFSGTISDEFWNKTTFCRGNALENVVWNTATILVPASMCKCSPHGRSEISPVTLSPPLSNDLKLQQLQGVDPTWLLVVSLCGKTHDIS